MNILNKDCNRCKIIRNMIDDNEINLDSIQKLQGSSNIDGAFGPDTEGRVKTYQKSNKLAADACSRKLQLNLIVILHKY